MAKAAKQESDSTRRILTPMFRVSYPHVFKPTAMGNAEPKYSISMLFDKKADLSVIKLAIKHAKIDEFGPDEKNWPKGIASCVTDGDDPKFEDKEGHAGHWIVKATSYESAKPGVVDQNADPIINQADFYPGCYARAQIYSRVWEFPKGSGRYGVQFILDHVQKWEDGKPFSNKKAANEVFNPISVDNEEIEQEESEEDFA